MAQKRKNKTNNINKAGKAKGIAENEKSTKVDSQSDENSKAANGLHKDETTDEMKGGTVEVAKANVTERLLIPKGLSNLGNTCFYNSTLQCLLHTHPISHYIDQIQKRLEGNNPVIVPKSYSIKMSEKRVEMAKMEIPMPSDPQIPFYYAFRKLINEFSTNNNGRNLNPRPLFDQIHRKVPRFRGWNQQDAHELLRYLLDNLRQDEIIYFEQAFCEQFQVDFRDKRPERKEKVEELKWQFKALMEGPARPILDAVFGGKLQQTIYCHRCHHTSVCLEPFFDLSLPIHYPEREARSRQAPFFYHPHGQQKPPTQNQQTNKMPHGQQNGSKTEENQTKSDEKSTNKIKKSNQKAVEDDNEITNSQLIHGKHERERRKKEQKKRSQQKKKLQKIGRQRSTPSVPDADDNQTHNGDDADSQRKIEETEEKDTEKNEPIDPIDGDNEQELLSNAVDSNSAVYLAEIEHDNISRNSLNGTPNHLQNGIEQEATISCSESIKNGESDYPIENGQLAPSQPSENADEIQLENGHEEQPLEEGDDDDTSGVQPLTENIPDEPRQQKSVIGALRNFTDAEILAPGENGYRCGKCTEMAKKADKKAPPSALATKRYLILTPPLILTLHLKRFEQIGPRNMKKFNGHIHFDMLLDLAPFCSKQVKRIQSGQKQLLYSLYGIVCHSGGLTGGHYISYVRSRPTRNPERLVKLFQQAYSNGNQTPTEEAEELEQKFRQLAVEMNGNDHMGISEEKNQCELDRIRREHAQSEWYHCSDSYVHKVDQEQVLKAQAYILFYERIH